MRCHPQLPVADIPISQRAGLCRRPTSRQAISGGAVGAMPNQHSALSRGGPPAKAREGKSQEPL